MLILKTLCQVTVCGLLLAACSFGARPDIERDQKAALSYLYSHCQNGARVRKLYDASVADESVSDSARLKKDRIDLDRELTICAQETTDEWTSQASSLMSLADAGIDENFCNDERPNPNASASVEDFKASEEVYYYCLAGSAQRRQRSILKIVAETSSGDLKAYGKALAAGALQVMRVDESTARLP